MPTAQQNPKVIKASLFAALMAGSDTSNACEAEAVSKFRALRRMAVDAGLRIVDVLEMPEVKRAIDQQMQPVRQKNDDLEKALEQAGALREELTQRTRDVRKLAELLAEQEETGKALREELAAAKCAAAQAARMQAQQPQAGSAAARTAPVGVVGPATHSFGAQSWAFEVGAVVVVLMLMVMSAFHCQTDRGQSGNHKQGQRIAAHGGSGQYAHRRSAAGRQKYGDLQKALIRRGADADGHVRNQLKGSF